MKDKRKKPAHYISNEELSKALLDYKIAVKKAKEEGKSKPKIPEYIGECFMKIAEHLSYSPNFIGYSFREELVSDGIENCLMYFENYDPETISKRTGLKTVGPFPYFTQVVFYAFLRRIAKEKKQQYVKAKSIEASTIMEELSGEDLETLGGDAPEITNQVGTAMYDNISEFIASFEASMAAKKKKPIDKKKKS